MDEDKGVVARDAVVEKSNFLSPSKYASKLLFLCCDFHELGTLKRSLFVETASSDSLSQTQYILQFHERFQTCLLN